MQLGSSKDRWANLKPSSTVRHWHILNYIYTHYIYWHSKIYFTAISCPIPNQVILGSWGLLFMFNLDDLTGVAGEILGSSDDQFQRCLCWNYVPWRVLEPKMPNRPKIRRLFFWVQVFRILINNINFYQHSATLSGKSRKFHSLTVWKGSQIGSRKFCWASWHGHFEADATTAAFAAVSATRPDSEIRELPLLTDVKLKHSSKCRPGCGKASDDSVMIHICGDFSGQPVTPGQLWGCKQFQATWSLFWHWNGKSTLRCMLLTGAFCCKKLLVSTSLPLPPARISKDPEEARLLKPGNSVYLTATDSHLRFVNDKFIQTTWG